MTTFGAMLEKHSITIPAHILADAEVPVLTGAQRQGDVGIFPTDRLTLKGELAPVPVGGVQVVRGEAGGHTHWLDGSGDVRYAAAPSGGLLLGELVVGDGSTAWLTHEDEHGSNAIGPGSYRLTGKREQADEIRRVTD